MKQNKKGNVAVIAIIVVIVAVTAGIIGWKFAKKSQTPIETKTVAQQPTANPTNQNQTVAQQTEGMVYKNEKYGFQLTLPEEWEDYKITQEQTTTYGENVSFQLQSRSSGYSTVMRITVQDLFSYNKMLTDCANGTEKSCYDYNSYLWGKTSKYAVYRIGNEDPSSDLMVRYNQIPEIKKSFKVININDDTANWQTYRSDKYGFQLTLPESLNRDKVFITNYKLENGLWTVASISFTVPIKDKDYSKNAIKGEDEKYYWTAFIVSVDDISAYNKRSNSTFCKSKKADITCPYPPYIIGQNDRYIFSQSGPQDYPDEIKVIMNDIEKNMDAIKKSFKAL